MAKGKLPEDTPLIKQFFSVKAEHPEAVLLYRVGDFYESYSSDAVLVSKVLGLVLTKKSNGEKGYIEMAGFPHHAIDVYLPSVPGTRWLSATSLRIRNLPKSLSGAESLNSSPRESPSTISFSTRRKTTSLLA